MINRYSDKELRQFAYTMAIMILLLFVGLLPWLFDYPPSYLPAILAVVFAALGLVAPRLLGPVYWLWMKLAHYLGIINGRILLFIVYYLVFVPAGMIARLFGFDPMRKKPMPGSYYITRENSHNDMENPF